jgi:hypothetical protein
MSPIENMGGTASRSKARGNNKAETDTEPKDKDAENEELSKDIQIAHVTLKDAGTFEFSEI